jgi:hypothetical protein
MSGSRAKLPEAIVAVGGTRVRDWVVQWWFNGVRSLLTSARHIPD